MPRNKGNGRTGQKHKKVPLFDGHRQPKVEEEHNISTIDVDAEPSPTPQPPSASPSPAVSMPTLPVFSLMPPPPPRALRPSPPPQNVSTSLERLRANQLECKQRAEARAGSDPPAPSPPDELMDDPHRSSRLRMFAAAFAGVQEPWNAIVAAEACEDLDMKNHNSSGEENGEQTEEYDLEEAAVKVRYKHALRSLKEELCDWSEDGVCGHQRSCIWGWKLWGVAMGASGNGRFVGVLRRPRMLRGGRARFVTLGLMPGQTLEGWVVQR